MGARKRFRIARRGARLGPAVPLLAAALLAAVSVGPRAASVGPRAAHRTAPAPGAAVVTSTSVAPRPTSTSVAPRPTPTPTAAPATLPAQQVFGPGGVEGTVQTLVDGARGRVLVEAYTLDDPAVVAALGRAVRRGVDVRVMLDPRGLNSASTVAALRAAGVRTRAPNPSYVAHLDMVVVDASAVVVLTSFLSADNLGPTGQAYAVVDRDRLDALQGASLFYDDWLRRPVRLFGRNLIVLPDSAGTIAAGIDRAGARIELYTSGLSDPAILSSLRAARGRGVVARVLTQSSSNTAALRAVAAPGRVRFRDAGRGTVLVIDRRRVVLGSMDLSANTLTSNRELAVVVGGQAVAAYVDRLFFATFAQGQIPKVAPAPAPPSRSRGRTVTRGALTLTPSVPSLVRVGGEGVIVASTVVGALVRVSIAYPGGSSPATTAGAALPSGRGTYVFRWILPSGIKPGQALVTVTARSRGRTIFSKTLFTVAR